MKTTQKINRRDFIKVSALAGGGLMVSLNSCVSAERLNAPVRLHPFLRIYPDNTVEVILSKIEMGQGIWTTLPMLIAEELDCEWSNIKVVPRGSGTSEDSKANIFLQSTGGSDTTRSEFDRYRTAGATVRTMLVYAASKRWKVPELACKTVGGFVISGEKKLSYGELASEAATQSIPDVKLRQPHEWKIIGTSHNRLDIPEKINGKARYGIDIQFPGLCTAVVSRPPVFGSTLKSFDDKACRAVTGVIDVIHIPSGVAVLADNFWSAKTGRDALKIEWETSASEGISSDSLLDAYRKLARQPGKVFMKKGNVSEELGAVTPHLEAEYTFPYLAHAPMETLNCTAVLNDRRCQIWTGTQSPVLHQQEAAEFLNLNLEDIEFNTPFVGGSFGRRGSFAKDYVIEAVQLAKASKRPVKVVWSREDDITGGFYRPVYLHRLAIKLNKDGVPASWQHRVVGQSLFLNTPLEKDLVQAEGYDYSSVDGVNGSPYFSPIPDVSLELHTTTVPVPVLAWRSVGNTHTAFVMETVIDELAFIAKKDPVEYRRILLKDHPRHLAVLNKTVEKAGWNNTLPPGRFQGIALHAAMRSIICQVAEVSIDDGKIRVHKVVCTIDCGLAVNPDGIRAQMEGSIVYGLTAALYGEISITNGKADQKNFNDYRMVRIHECPEIDVHIMTSTGDMGGAGEPAVAPIAPAVANAIYRATGKRIRQLPIRI